MRVALRASSKGAMLMYQFIYYSTAIPYLGHLLVSLARLAQLCYLKTMYYIYMTGING